MTLRALALILFSAGSLLAGEQQQKGGKEAGGPGEFHGELRDKQGVMMKAHMLAPSAMPPLRSLALLLVRSEEHTSELQSPYDLVCRLLLEKKKYRCCSGLVRLNLMSPFIATCRPLATQSCLRNNR